MHLISLEFIASILTNLTEEITKIMDICSEGSNTANTVRNLKSKIVNIESKIKTLISQSVLENGSTTPINELINRFDKLANWNAGNGNNSSSALDRQSKN